MNIGEKIKFILQKKEIKPYEMAKKVKISQGNMYEILNGKNKNPGVYTVKKIADYLCVSIDELVI